MKCVDTAINLIKTFQAMCARAGLRLHKFISNKKEVIKLFHLKIVQKDSRARPVERSFAT